MDFAEHLQSRIEDLRLKIAEEARKIGQADQVKNAALRDAHKAEGALRECEALLAKLTEAQPA